MKEQFRDTGVEGFIYCIDYCRVHKVALFEDLLEPYCTRLRFPIDIVEKQVSDWLSFHDNSLKHNSLNPMHIISHFIMQDVIKHFNLTDPIVLFRGATHFKPENKENTFYAMSSWTTAPLVAKRFSEGIEFGKQDNGKVVLAKIAPCDLGANGLIFNKFNCYEQNEVLVETSQGIRPTYHFPVEGYSQFNLTYT